MKVNKEKLLETLLQDFYVFTLKRYNKYPAEYSKGYRKGMLEVIEEVNSYREEE